MKTFLSTSGSRLAAAVLLAGLVVPASAQTTCAVSAGSPAQVRSQGNTELVTDITASCTGGTPTAAGSLVPQVNITVFLTTNFTSKVTQPATGNVGVNFSEALLLVDEPNRGTQPVPAATAAVAFKGFPLLNCGNQGAPDNGPMGPGVCAIHSTGTPAQTYDGTQNAGPASLNCLAGATRDQPESKIYGCGRPNVFQARLAAGSPNGFVFLDVPFDPPAAGATRTLRITNVRVDAAQFSGMPGPVSITATVSATSGAVTATPLVLFSSPSQTVAMVQSGLTAFANSSVVTVSEGFASAWKYRNISYQLANANFIAGNYVYKGMGNTNHPNDAAQNVPGVLYNNEGGFQWQNNGANKPPNPDPPQGYQIGGITSNNNYPLMSFTGYHPGFSTEIEKAGVVEAGTRIAFSYLAPGESVTAPNIVYLYETASPATLSGVLVLTQTDAAGAGGFNPAPGTSTTRTDDEGVFVYEVLYSNPFSEEFATVEFSVTGDHEAVIYASFAPFYNVPSAALATPTAANPTPTAIPRFNWDGTMLFLKPQAVVLLGRRK
jgi:hypothetical protein